MIDSPIKGMSTSSSDKSDPVGVKCGTIGGKRPSGDKSLPQCKKRKKAHKWPKKRYSTEVGGRGRRKAKRRVRTKPEAPFNSTQFIMNEHDNLNESDLSSNRPRRRRDSSLSMDSEEAEDYFTYYSSPEEEEFMTKQFWYAYEDFHAERLDAMPKSQLVQEYFSLEEKVTLLEKELNAAREMDRRRIRDPSPVDDDDEGEVVPGEVPVDAETAAKIEIFRSEIQKLEEENERLKEQNVLLRRNHCCRRCSAASSSSSSGSSSSDSSSSSSSSSSGGSGSSESENEGDADEDAPDDGLPTKEGIPTPASDQELEISETSLREPVERYGGADSGIASSEGGVSSASSGEDAKEKEEIKPPIPLEGGIRHDSAGVESSQVILAHKH